MRLKSSTLSANIAVWLEDMEKTKLHISEHQRSTKASLFNTARGHGWLAHEPTTATNRREIEHLLLCGGWEGIPRSKRPVIGGQTW